MYIVGKIVNTHGIKGEVKIINLSDFNRFSIGKVVLYEENKKYKELIIESVREHKGCLLVTFKGINNINNILFLKGKDIYSETKENVVEDDSYYYDELIGKQVYTEKGLLVGKVISLLEVPQGHILEIQTDSKKALVPFRKEFVSEVSDKIVIIPIEGLLWK